MAYTAEQLANLEKVSASGQLRVQLGDKVIQYQDGAALKEAIRQARADLAGTSNNDPLRYRVGRFCGG